MDYEKKYKEALERAKEIKSKLLSSHLSTESCKAVAEYIDTIIPELTESEDERIRKAIMVYIDWLDGKKDCQPKGAYSIRDMLTYLEKQKEQKPAEWSEFDKGVLKDAICAADILGNDESFNKGNPNLAKAFRIAKDWLRELPERFNLQPKQEWSEEDEQNYQSIRAILLEDTTKKIGKRTYGGVLEWYESKGKGRFNLPKIKWNEDDEKMLNLTKTQLRILQSHLSYSHSESMSDMEYSSRLLQIEKCVSWLDIRLKSLRPQPRKEIYLEAKHDLAIKFMNYLDENRPEGKMSLSNCECEDIDKAFKENDWTKIMKYIEKYSSHWKSSEELIGCLERLIAFKNPEPEDIKGCESLLKHLKKL